MIAGDGSVITLTEWDELHSRRIAALNAAHKRLWRLAVYAHPSISPVERRLLQAAAWEVFGVPNRYLLEREAAPYLEEVWDTFLSEKASPDLRQRAIERVAASRTETLDGARAAFEAAVTELRSV